jgi:hypothetical protein
MLREKDNYPRQRTRAGWLVKITSDQKWSENSPKYLGIIEDLGIACAWYENGCSVHGDSGFDLTDVPRKSDMGDLWRCLADAA